MSKSDQNLFRNKSDTAVFFFLFYICINKCIYSVRMGAAILNIKLHI